MVDEQIIQKIIDLYKYYTENSTEDNPYDSLGVIHYIQQNLNNESYKVKKKNETN